MSQHRDILAALEKLRSGVHSLTSEQYVALLDAVEQTAAALHVAPRGSDPIATGLWWNHERTPALTRLAHALAFHAGSTAAQQRLVEFAGGEVGTLRADDGAATAAPELSDLDVARALHQSLLDNTRR